MVIVPVSKFGTRGARGAAFTPRRQASSLVGRGTNAHDVFAGRDIIRISVGGAVTDYPSSSDTDASRGSALNVAFAAEASGDVYLCGPDIFEGASTVFLYQLANKMSVYGCGAETVVTTDGTTTAEVLNFSAGLTAHLKCASTGENFEPFVITSAATDVVDVMYVTLNHAGNATHAAFWPQSATTGVINAIGCSIVGGVELSGGTGGILNIYNSDISNSGTTKALFTLARTNWAVTSANNVWTHDGSGNSDTIFCNLVAGTSATFTGDVITMSTGTGAAVYWFDIGSNVTLTNCVVNAPKGGDGVIAGGAPGTILVDGGSVTGTSGVGDDLVNDELGDTFNITNSPVFNTSTGTINTV